MTNKSSFRTARLWNWSKFLLFVPLLLAALLNVGIEADAHSKAHGIVKERMDLMISFGDAIKPLAAMFKKQQPYDPNLVARNAAAIGARTAVIGRLFPHGSMDKPSKALASIWEDWSTFEQLAAELGAASALLAQAAQQADFKEARREFVRVAKICTSCHTKFRVPK